VLYLQVASPPQLGASCVSSDWPARHLGGDLASAVPRDSPPASHATRTHSAGAHRRCSSSGCMRGALIPVAVESDTCSTKQVTKKEKHGVGVWNYVLLTVCCLLCSVLLPSFPTSQILPFSLYHLSHTEIRMDMTQQGHCFVVLFYLFLDNEKSAEGLAWCSLSPMKLLPPPYGLSAGGYLTLLTRRHQKHGSWSLPFRGLWWIHTITHPGWNRIALDAVSLLDTQSWSQQRGFYFLFWREMVEKQQQNWWGNILDERWLTRRHAVGFMSSELLVLLVVHSVHTR